MYRTLALVYAKQFGKKVIPVCDKRPYLPDWPKLAGSTPDLINALDWSGANGVGMIPGEDEVVLDIDPRNGGFDWWKQWNEKLPKTLMARTGGGGLHLHFRARPGAVYPHGLARGVDLLHGDGRQVVMPGSLHSSGRRYKWISKWTSTPMADAPDWFATPPVPAMARPPVDRSSKGADLGSRNDTLTRKVGSWIASRLDERDIEHLAVKYAAGCSPQMDRAEALRVVASIRKTDARNHGRGSLAQVPPQASRIVRHSAIIEQAREIGRTPRIPLGIDPVDRAIGGGVLPRWTVVIGAFTGDGKTTLVARCALSFASRGHPTLVVTAELADIEFAYRVDQMVEPGSTVDPRYLSESDLGKITAEIEAWALQHDSSELAPVVLVDYLQRLRVSNSHSREREVATVCEEIQSLARRLGIIVVLAAQLNRLSQSEGRPALHHLRESGLGEQIADVALLLDRGAEGRCKIIVAKRRWGGEGPVGQVIELSIDWQRGAYREVDQISERWVPLTQKVVAYLTSVGGKAKMRDVIGGVRMGPKHTNRAELEEAAIATRAFVIVDNRVMLTPLPGADMLTSAPLNNPPSAGSLTSADADASQPPAREPEDLEPN